MLTLAQVKNILHDEWIKFTVIEVKGTDYLKQNPDITTSFEIQVPIVDDMSDFIGLYLTEYTDGHMTLTDDGHVYSELWMRGQEISEQLFQKQVHYFMSNYFYSDYKVVDGDEIVVTCRPEVSLSSTCYMFALAISTMTRCMSEKLIVPEVKRE
jgi:hypothetical protein